MTFHKMKFLRDTRSIRVDQIKNLPTKPGCYLFKGPLQEGDDDRLLYIGKAKNLRNRVRQYFHGQGDGRPSVFSIRKKTKSIEFITVADEQDALVLENDLIKRYKPFFNLFLKDDKHYLSLRLDKGHEWPKIDIVRKIKKDSATYLGPFSSATRLRETLEFLQKTFPLRTCSDHKLYNRSRPCLEYDMKRCVAPCVKLIAPKEYSKLVEQVEKFLKGESQDLIEELQVKMTEYSKAEEFEKAAEMRDRLFSIEATLHAQTVRGIKGFKQGVDQDAIGLAWNESKTFVVVSLIFIRYGTVWDKRVFEFKKPHMEESELLLEFLERYYSSGKYIPDEILVPIQIAWNQDLVPLNLIVPKSKEKQDFLNLAEENAEAELISKLSIQAKGQDTLASLQSRLKLSKIPSRIDGIDVSHHQGAEVVASVVRFLDGYPDKEHYRKVKLSTDVIDDFKSIYEVIQRRYKTKEDLPDLIVIDGGKGQLSSAHEALKEKNLRDWVELVSLAKARNAEEVDPLNPLNRERVFKVGRKNPILLKQESPEELLLSYLRDEAHRFAITYHRQRKTKGLSFSVLDEVEGMTQKTKLKLLRAFGSLEEIKKANDLELLNYVKPKLLAALRDKLGETQAE